MTRGSYTTSLDQIENSTASDNSGINYQYSSDGIEYCLTAILGKFAMHTSSSQSEPTEGVCSDHDGPDVGPAVDPVVYTQTGGFDERQPIEGGGVNTPINLGYDIQPTDYVFILFNAKNNITLTLSDANGNQYPVLYQRSMGNSGYQAHIAFGVDGQAAQQTLNVNSCWNLTCKDYTPSLSAAYVAYVIRGLGPSPNLAATYTPYGVQPGHDVTVGPAAQTLAKGKLAIFSYTYYGSGVAATESDASSPALTWTTDSTAPLNHMGTAIASRHSYATGNTSVRYQMTMPSDGMHYHGSVLFTIQ